MNLDLNISLNVKSCVSEYFTRESPSTKEAMSYGQSVPFVGVTKLPEDRVICQRKHSGTLALLLPAAIETAAHQSNSTSYHCVLYMCVSEPF